MSSKLYELVLQAVETISDSTPLTFSVITMVKSKLVDSLLHCYEPLDRPRVPLLRHSLLPTETAVPIPPEFLDAEVTSSTPFSPSWLRKLLSSPNFWMDSVPTLLPTKHPKPSVHMCWLSRAPRNSQDHQIRLANGMHRILDLDQSPNPVMLGNPHTADLLNAIIDSTIFQRYFEAGQPLDQMFSSPPGEAWLTDSSARVQIKDTLTTYAPLSSSNIAMRIGAILAGLESLHPS
ncbi:hypothetical protein B0H13DRAFT_2331445 [Mycena leptocephala]|nr:hypothetical protein B0H13DRAFT_2331445 [Mycena leptocephala]